MKKYDYIDCLRGVAILWVILIHAPQNYSFEYPTPYLLSQLAWNGMYGVQLFFVVSAFTLALSYEQRNIVEKRPLLNFFIRRFFRVAPMFYLAIVFYTLVNNYHSSVAFLLSNIFFVFGFHPYGNFSIIPYGWTIGTEMSFYLAFPFFYRIMADVRRSIITLGVCLVVALIAYYMMNNNLDFINSIYKIDKESMEIFSSRLIIYQLPVFLTGILIYRILKDSDFRLMSHPRLLLSIGAIFFAELIYYIGIQKLHLFTILFGMLILVLSAYPHRLFVNVILKEIGKVSFSMYLLHNFVIMSLKALVPSVLSITIFITFPVVIAICYIISKISYELLEKNFIKLGKLIIDRMEKDKYLKSEIA